MNIIIIGAGNIGLHLCRVFSQVNFSTILVDTDAHKLEQASREIDVGTRWGSAIDGKLLEELKENKPDLLVALTQNDEVNLVACRIAKKLGYPQTIARLRSRSYFDWHGLNFETLFSVDHIIGPEKLTAEGIAKMILIPGSKAEEQFMHGSIQMRTLTIPEKWKGAGMAIKDRQKMQMPNQMMVGLIERKIQEGNKIKHKLIFPHGKDQILAGDEVTFIGRRDAMLELNHFLEIAEKIPKSVMIAGGSLIAIHLATILTEKKLRVTIVEKDFHKCNLLSQILPQCTILQRDATDYNYLRAEKVDQFDVFVAATGKDEVNFLTSLAAKEIGCKKIILSLSDTSYQPLMERLGLEYATSPRNFATNHIFSIAREKTISSMVSSYENKAEIMEVKVSMNSKIAGIPIKHLGPELPFDFLIVVIQSRGRIFIADESRVLSPGDTAIIICDPRHLEEIKKIF